MKLVSGILITRGRQRFAAQALQCFLSQDYPSKTLVIVDDSEDRSFPEGVNHPLVRYELSPERSIAQKRNMAVAFAEDADVIAVFDSDDWSAPERLTSQMRLLEESGQAVCGFHSLLFHVETSGLAYKYINDRSFSLGTALMFARSFWVAHPFRPGPDFSNVGEDNEFVKDARNLGELVSVDAGPLMVARIHPENTSPKNLDGCQTSYVPVPRETLPAGFFK